MPENLLTPLPAEPSYLAFLGRISPEKAVDRAIHIAERCGLPLKIAAKVDAVDHDYFEEMITPLLSQTACRIHRRNYDAQKSEFLSSALALIVPIDWPEPFGLVMIEAMACGAPVIAFNRGAVPELIEDGLTGFVVEDETSAVGADTSSSRVCRAGDRKRFEERFTARRMAKQYLAVYRDLLGATLPSPENRFDLRAMRSFRPFHWDAFLASRAIPRQTDDGHAAIIRKPWAAEVIADVSDECGADRRADANRTANSSLREIEMTRGAGKISDDEWNQHRQRRA